MIILKCAYKDESFFNELVDLLEQYPNIHVEGYDMNYSDTKKKGYLKCKSAFGAKRDPFVGVWINDIPAKGFYSEVNECTLDNIKEYLNSLSDEDFERTDSDD